MEILKLFYCCILINMTIYQVHCEIITMTYLAYGFGAGLMGMILSSLNSNTQDHRNRGFIERGVRSIGRKLGLAEGCENYWIPGNLDALEYDLRQNVFGQSFAVDIVLDALKNHLKHEPKRSLVLSFHGSPGTGKNFISQAIINNMFRKKGYSDFAIVFRSSIDFPLKSDVNEYKAQITEKINAYVKDCHRSIFVFDEVDKMPNGTLDVLSGFVKAPTSRGIDFRRLIFILLSNLGSAPIMDITIESRIEDRKEREDIDDLKLERVIKKAAFEDDGGLKRTGLVEHYGVSHFVPFLPLEKVHILQCLERIIVESGQILSDELIDQVFEELHFIPEPDGPFAYNGCKGVYEVASKLIQRETRRKGRWQ